MFYTKKDIQTALESVLNDGDVVFIHSNLGFFGELAGATTKAEVCNTFLMSINNIIGRKGAIFAPSFTYSFCKGEVFDLRTTPSSMGVLSEHIRNNMLSFRSNDPCYSVVGIGHRVYDMLGNLPDNSFAMDSFFDRFYRVGGKILNFNTWAGSTLIHYAERLNNVPYRFDKTFVGITKENNTDRYKYINHNYIKQVEKEHTIYVRVLEDRYIADFTIFDKIARETGKYITTPLGMGEIGSISAADTVSIVSDTLKEQPYFLTKGIGSTSSEL